LGAGRLTFDGGSHRHGEQTSSPYLQRVFTRFDEMDMLQFEALATQLYGPMLLTSNLSSTADVEEDA
jgi:exodeoxyribonuclease V gamma subunit